MNNKKENKLLGERNQKVQISSYKIDKSWEYIVKHGDYN